MNAPQVNPIQQNLFARANLLRTGIQMVKRIQPITGAQLGDQVRVPLLRMGIMTGVTLLFTVPVGDVTTPVFSPCGPWNVAQRVTYTDFSGTNRTNTSGFHLYAGESMKNSELLGGTPYDNAGAYGYQNTNILTHVDTPPTDNGNVYFSLYIPLAYDPANDLTGAVLTQTNVGEHYVTVQLANALVGADPWAFPFISGTVPLGAAGITIEAFQHYIQPQSMSIENLPVIDLSTVYGYEGAYQSSANIAAGQSKFIDYPNNRSIFSSLITYENGSAFTANETDVTLVTLLANSNTNFREMTPRLMRQTQRQLADGDLPSSTYYIGSRRQPILTQLYANVQAKFDVNDVGETGVNQFCYQFEVQYPSGSPLPGISG